MIIYYIIMQQNGDSPLQVACVYGNTEIVKLLIQCNADIELKNKV